MWFLHEKANSFMLEMLKEAGGMYYQFIDYEREGTSSTMIPWSSYPFATML